MMQYTHTVSSDYLGWLSSFSYLSDLIAIGCAVWLAHQVFPVGVSTYVFEKEDLHFRVKMLVR